MARSTGIGTTLTCVSCKQPRRVTWWYGDRAEEWNTETIKQSCAHCSADPPHWEIGFSGNSQHNPTARSVEGKAVVYVLPDGDYMSVDTSVPDMEHAAASVGVRREFGSIRDLERFQKEQANRKREEWQQMADEGAYGVTVPDFKQMQDSLYGVARNDVLDYDYESRKEGEGGVRRRAREEEVRHQQSMERFKRARDGSIRLPDGSRVRIGNAADSRRYERLRGGK